MARYRKLVPLHTALAAPLMLAAVDTTFAKSESGGPDPVRNAAIVAGTALEGSGAEDAGVDPITEDPRMLGSMYSLFQRTLGDVGTSERGAWIVLENGLYRCEAWPFMARDRMVRPSWPPPPGTIAAVHTHPTSPEFSRQDLRFAQITKRPLYLIHLRGIWKYDLQTERVSQVKESGWRAALKKRGRVRDRCSDVSAKRP